VDGVILAGGAQFGDRRVHRDDNGHLYVQVADKTLLIDGRMLVNNYTPSETAGALGLNMARALADVNPQTVFPDLVGDLAPLDGDLIALGVQLQYNSLGNVQVNPLSPEPGRADTLYDRAGNDHIISGGGDDHLYATRGGDDVLDAEAGRDYADGGDGHDVIYGGADSDILVGGAGNDRLYADTSISAADAIVLGNKQPGSGLKGDWLAGGSGDDTLVGGAGNDVLTGGGGHDLLIGGAGDDDLLGDRDWVATSFEWTVTDLGGGRHYYFPIDEFPAVDAADVIYAGEGNDYAIGGGGNDVLFGEGGNDTMGGQDGNDLLIGGTGVDTLYGGEGQDIYIFNRGDGHDTVYDSVAEHNIFRFGAGISSSDITLRLGSLLLDLGSGDAVHIQDFNQNDVFNSSSIDRFEFEDGTVLTTTELLARGFDLDGTAGDDPIVGTNTTDRITGYGGHDTLLGEAGNDTLDGGEGDDELQGGGGNDVLSGGAGNDLLAGDDPNDTLVVGGEDVLDGGAGADELQLERMAA